MTNTRRPFILLNADPIGTIYINHTTNNLQFLILRGPSSLCAYLIIPADHPAAHYDYEALPDTIPVHGGFTFSDYGDNIGDGTIAGHHQWVYGWDYAHSGDRFFTEYLFPIHTERHGWTVPEVEAESQATIAAFTTWMHHLEKGV